MRVTTPATTTGAQAGDQPRWRVDAATPGDVPQIAELLCLLYEAEAPRLVPDDTHAFIELLQAGLRARGHELAESSFIVRDGDNPGRAGGYIALSCDRNPRKPPFSARYLAEAIRRFPVRQAALLLWRQYRLSALLCAPLPAKTAQMHSLIIRPELRGQGLAKRLINQAESHARHRRQHGVTLYVLDGNPVEPLYRRLGYQRIRTPKPAFPLPHPGMAMHRAL